MHAATNLPARSPLWTALDCPSAPFDKHHREALFALIGVFITGTSIVLLRVLRTCCGPAQELTRHAANLGMLAAATLNPDQRKHFYLGFQAEHKLAYNGAWRRLPCILRVCRRSALCPGAGYPSAC